MKEQFGQYRILRELGSGGMGTVFEAVHEELQKRVAVKVMRAELAIQPRATARFVREGRLAAQIRHPHVVEVFDIGAENGVPFLVMELLDGETLARRVERRGKLPVGPAVDLFLPVISAVAVAHQLGVIHRDLKPGNVMLAKRGQRLVQPVVLDFGISKMAEDDADGNLTRSDSLLGTFHYMSPEQTRGAKLATAASDQYALGVMLYECVTGVLPFQGASPYELMHAIVTSSPRRPSAVCATVPRALDAIILRAMHRDPEKRFPSVQVLGSALLSVASRGAQELWGPEFDGDAHDGVTLEETRHDSSTEEGANEAQTGKPLVRPLASDESRRTRRWPPLVGAALLVAATAVVAMVRPGRSTLWTSAETAPSVAASAGAALPPGVAAEPLASAPIPPFAGPEAVASSSPEGADDQAVPVPRTSPRSSRTPRATPRLADAPARPTTAASASGPERAAPPAPETGSNNVPILE